MVQDNKNIIAHVKKINETDFAEPQTLEEHLQKTAYLAANYSAVFGMDKIGKVLGLVHDLGKATKAFQERIRLKSGYDLEAHLEGKTPGHVDHSTAGAKFLVEQYGTKLGLILAYIISGHHAGLPDGQGPHSSALSQRLTKQIDKDFDHVIPWIAKQLPEITPQDLLPKKSKMGSLDPYKIHLFIRMLFSALTDADFIDTENYMNPAEAKKRGSGVGIDKLAEHLENFLTVLRKKESTPVNQKRGQILRWSLDAAERPPGLFSLTVPTGGGKTISSMAFALKHAQKHALRRVIYVIPYTSIIIQNAQVFRDIFKELGDHIILEHHSNLDPKDETPFNRLAAENWDAPIIVTTNVQFFESFYANKSSSCRKLHNIADSVVIFDEAQMLPPEFLSPAVRIIRELTEDYGCSAVICTATQPAILKSEFLKEGLENVREIVPDPQQLYRDFKRVTVRQVDRKLTSDELAERIAQEKQVLAIVNTRKEAREIWEKLTDKNNTEHCFHLSTMMCPQHRLDTLDKIRQRLRSERTCRVVSTQLIEAGVDVDFPVVYRAAAGIDSIAQSAGRCNREGRLKEGTVYIFEGENPPPPGHLRYSAQSGFYTLKAFPEDPLELKAIEFYFRDFYSNQYNAHRMDKKEIISACSQPPDSIPYARIAREFKMISQKTFSILVPYGEHGEKTIKELRRCYKGMVPYTLRKTIQRYLVNLHEQMFAELFRAGVVDDVFKDGKYFILLNQDIYTEGIGLNPDMPEFFKSESLII